MELATGTALKAGVSTVTNKVINASFTTDVSDFTLNLRVKRFAESRTVFGLRRREPVYINSPLISAMEGVMSISGNIYVAVVPPGEGKTTAANAFFQCFPACKGIAICPGGDASVSYHEKMASFLSVSPNKKGWMQIFLRALHEGATAENPRTRRPHILVLDEFLAGISETGQMTTEIKADLTFVFNIKSLITEWNVCVIILTPNSFGAGLALGLNGLSGIVPLPGLFSGVPCIKEYQNLRVGEVQWMKNSWSQDMLIDLVRIRHGPFFSRETVREWIHNDDQLSFPRLILRHAETVAYQQTHPDEYISEPCGVQNVPTDTISTTIIGFLLKSDCPKTICLKS